MKPLTILLLLVASALQAQNLTITPNVLSNDYGVDYLHQMPDGYWFSGGTPQGKGMCRTDKNFKVTHFTSNEVWKEKGYGGGHPRQLGEVLYKFVAKYDTEAEQLTFLAVNCMDFADAKVYHSEKYSWTANVVLAYLLVTQVCLFFKGSCHTNKA